MYCDDMNICAVVCVTREESDISTYNVSKCLIWCLYPLLENKKKRTIKTHTNTHVHTEASDVSLQSCDSAAERQQQVKCTAGTSRVV